MIAYSEWKVIYLIIAMFVWIALMAWATLEIHWTKYPEEEDGTEALHVHARRDG